MALKAGDLIHLITIQVYIGTQDPSTGEPLMGDGNWKTVAENIFAQVKTLSGRDYVASMTAGYVASHSVKMYYRPDILPKRTRFIFNGAKLYAIHADNMEGMNYGLQVLCRSGDQV